MNMKKADRRFLLLLIMQHRKIYSNKISNHFEGSKILLHDLEFTRTDLSGMYLQDLELFEFSNCILQQVKLDRVSANFFIKLFREKKIILRSIDFSGANLGSELVVQPEVGVACNISINMSELDLKNCNFTGCSLKGTLFENSDISGSTFLQCVNITPEQFAFCKNFDKAIFSDNTEQDNRFKQQITKIFEKGKAPEKQFNSYANFKLAHMFDPADEPFKRA